MKLHPTRTVAERLDVSVWTVTRIAKDHPDVYTLKVPGTTGGYLFSDDDVAKVAAHLKRKEVAA